MGGFFVIFRWAGLKFTSTYRMKSIHYSFVGFLMMLASVGVKISYAQSFNEDHLIIYPEIEFGKGLLNSKAYSSETYQVSNIGSPLFNRQFISDISVWKLSGVVGYKFLIMKVGLESMQVKYEPYVAQGNFTFNQYSSCICTDTFYRFIHKLAGLEFSLGAAIPVLRKETYLLGIQAYGTYVHSVGSPKFKYRLSNSSLDINDYLDNSISNTKFPNQLFKLSVGGVFKYKLANERHTLISGIYFSRILSTYPFAYDYPYPKTNMVSLSVGWQFNGVKKNDGTE